MCNAHCYRPNEIYLLVEGGYLPLGMPSDFFLKNFLMRSKGSIYPILQFYLQSAFYLSQGFFKLIGDYISQVHFLQETQFFFFFSY